jgi:hypothetical protein
MKLFLECKPDETLAVALGVSPRAVIHCHGKGRVSRNLRDHSGVTGMVDEDAGATETPTLREFAEVSNAYNVRLKLHQVQKNRLVVICPKLEDWVIEAAKASHVKMTKYNLSEYPNALHADINYRLPNFQRLLAELLSLKSPRLLRLQALLAGEPD